MDEGQLNAGLYRPDADRVTVREAAELFLEHCHKRMEERARMTRRTYTNYEGNIRNCICPDAERHAGRHCSPRLRPFAQGLAAISLRQLSASRVGDFCDALRAAGVSLATTRKVLMTLKLLLAHAVSRDLIAVHVARDVRVIGRRDGARGESCHPRRRP